MSQKNNEIKNIIFDLGGVIINIDYNLTANAFEQMGISNFKELFSQAQQSHLFDLYEKGQISSAEFRIEIKKIIGHHYTDEAIDKAWNALLLDIPPNRLTLLDSVKTKYNTFLLSNTNDIHIETFNGYLKQTFGINNLENYFNKLYLSYKVGMRKPDAEIFELVLSENNLVPEETLFIDDSIQHIESAKKLGIQAYWLDVKNESIIELFQNDLLLNIAVK
jgi:epoxide hydrolase-like predicted phosphatase